MDVHCITGNKTRDGAVDKVSSENVQWEFEQKSGDAHTLLSGFSQGISPNLEVQIGFGTPYAFGPIIQVNSSITSPEFSSK